MQDNIKLINDLENRLQQLIDEGMRLCKEREAYEKKLNERKKAIQMVNISNLWLMHEVAVLQREKAELERST